MFLFLVRNGRMPHLTPTAAREVESGLEFSSYILPKVLISTGAQQTTGITMTGDSLFVNGRAVGTAKIKSALQDFMQWVKRFGNVVFVAHNGRRFDFPVLTSVIISADLLEDFFNSAVGYLDSLALFKKVYRDRSGYRQEDLARDILGINYSAHDAVEDVQALTRLFQHTVTPDIIKFTYSLSAVYNQILSTKERARNLPTLTCLTARGVCKLPTAENIAASGLN